MHKVFAAAEAVCWWEGDGCLVPGGNWSRGVPCPWGVSAPRGCLFPLGCLLPVGGIPACTEAAPLWTEWLTDRCKNVTFATSLQMVTNWKKKIFVREHKTETSCEQDCIPVGCVSLLVAHTSDHALLPEGGACLWSREGGLLQGACLWSWGVCSWEDACLWSRGGLLLRGSAFVRGVPASGQEVCIPACNGADPPEENSWHTLLKILPCPNFIVGGKNCGELINEIFRSSLPRLNCYFL